MPYRDNGDRYIVNIELSKLIFTPRKGVKPDHRSPKTRKEIQSAFITFALDNDLVDLKTHLYLVYRHPTLHRLLSNSSSLPCDTIHPNDLFRYLRKLIKQCKPEILERKNILKQVISVEEKPPGPPSIPSPSWFIGGDSLALVPKPPPPP